MDFIIKIETDKINCHCHVRCAFIQICSACTSNLALQGRVGGSGPVGALAKLNSKYEAEIGYEKPVRPISWQSDVIPRDFSPIH